jgi:hypothetical protein
MYREASASILDQRPYGIGKEGFMAIRPIGASETALPEALGRARVSTAHGATRPAAPAKDRVSLSAESKAASGTGHPQGKTDAPALRLSPAELRALAAPDSLKSPLRKAADRNAAALSGEGEPPRPDARTRLSAGDRAIR